MMFLKINTTDRGSGSRLQIFFFFFFSLLDHADFSFPSVADVGSFGQSLNNWNFIIQCFSLSQNN